MKKIISLSILLLSFLIVDGFSAIRRTIIDFNTYDEKIKAQFTDPKESFITNVDGYPKLVVGYEDYMLQNWDVELGESSGDIKNKILSYCKSVKSQRFGNTLGVRIHFPKWNNNSYALIKPPFPIKIYDTNGQFINAENGVIPNVSEVKSVSVWVNGRNFNFGLAIRMKDRFENIHEFFMGWLYFDGWRKLTFTNPNFTENINAKKLKREPLYPYDIPYLVFDSFVIYRPADQIGGDFVTYIANMELEYTPYFVDGEDDIKDEEVWGIITKRMLQRQSAEEKRLIENIYLYQQEKKRTQEANKK
ncbi:MAG: flagellar filament outer layer protein FlaA [Brevinematales bacterium]|nr:flagellar filament outer layer protein FlaA [Brevinematales bacterium]